MDSETLKKGLSSIKSQADTKVEDLAKNVAEKMVQDAWANEFDKALTQAIDKLKSMELKDLGLDVVDTATANDLSAEPSTSEATCEESCEASCEASCEESCEETTSQATRDETCENSAQETSADTTTNNDPLSVATSTETKPKDLESDKFSQLEKLDNIFLCIIKGFTEIIIAQARGSAETVFDVSRHFLDDAAKNALNDFHQLYFGENGLQETATDINQEVDAMFDGIKKLVESGDSTDSELEKYNENDQDKVKRLSLTGLQKRLEMIISLDEGIKDKLVPVLSTMQFEDLINQRMKNLEKIWTNIIHTVTAEPKRVVFDKLVNQLSEIPTSQREMTQFYQIVLEKEPPEAILSQGSLMDILFDSE